MNITKEKTDWGVVYHYKNKFCRFALYAYDDEDKKYIWMKHKIK